MISYLLSSSTSTILINGHISPPLSLCCGVKQGDPIVGFLFILTMQFLATIIRSDPSIQPVSFQGLQKSITLHCDDVLLCIPSIHALVPLLSHLATFEKFSSLQINKNKTVINLPHGHHNSTPFPLLELI
eukprot:TRINITY_DN6461_c0_g3_i1.p1 TRINITY_DN6461_c0_g3~~TRINITY_DN6461_c0_g3_i1.p1  ORF type:complete len:130 (-),score=9.23 TRINITY_DN6461_c0_g3_i1:338-727(-)